MRARMEPNATTQHCSVPVCDAVDTFSNNKKTVLLGDVVFAEHRRGAAMFFVNQFIMAVIA